jgi:hypothetical protein
VPGLTKLGQMTLGGRKSDGSKVVPTERLQERAPGTLKAWNSLVSSITNDANQFNNDKERVGQTLTRVSRRHFECEVHLPGMQGKNMVLTFDNNEFQVSVHPEFPKLPLTIAIELDGEGQPASWLLGESTKENAKPPTNSCRSTS